MKNIKYALLAAVLVGFTACKSEDDFIDSPDTDTNVVLPALTAGTADFSNYVAIGASFTAGFADNGLFKASQENSFPNILAGHFANAGGGAFKQPMMNDNYGGIVFMGNRITQPRLVFGGAGPVPLESVVGPVSISTDLSNNPTGPFNNLGVPGAKSYHLLAPGYGNLGGLFTSPPSANPYAVRMIGSTANPNATVMDLAVAQAPTFFTLSEIGGNDVLGYATSGGDGSDAITPSALFDASLNGMVAMLTANGTNNAKGVIGNVPNITSLSYFTTVTHNPVPLDAASAAQANAAYGLYNAGIVQAFAYLVATTPMTQEDADAEIARRTIMFAESETNALVILDEDLTNLTGINPQLVNMRQATEADLITLPASSLIPTGVGVTSPMSDTFVLTPEEQFDISSATMAYNATIKSITDANPNLALVDLNSILAQASTTGIMFDEFDLNTELVFGGLVSLDGVHLTARGYALMANAFLDAIDTNFGSNFRASGNVSKAYDFGVAYSPLLP
ncbi:MAG: G-D-S-L family lipolytic protein [Oceanihabitans sp.]